MNSIEAFEAGGLSVHGAGYGKGVWRHPNEAPGDRSQRDRCGLSDQDPVNLGSVTLRPAGLSSVTVVRSVDRVR